MLKVLDFLLTTIHYYWSTEQHPLCLYCIKCILCLFVTLLNFVWKQIICHCNMASVWLKVVYVYMSHIKICFCNMASYFIEGINYQFMLLWTHFWQRFYDLTKERFDDSFSFYIWNIKKNFRILKSVLFLNTCNANCLLVIEGLNKIYKFLSHIILLFLNNGVCCFGHRGLK